MSITGWLKVPEERLPRMELPEGRRAPNHVNYKVLEPLMAPLHTLLRPLERARLLQNKLQIIIFIILAIILVALKTYNHMIIKISRINHPKRPR